MIKEGEWWVRSKSDPRWDANGTGLLTAGSYPDAEDHIDRMTRLYGTQPADLTIGWMKF